ncbi:hypothetical protein G6F31_019463 [Rhizopus arrhizus]|nr:hypothetical protein G6F31_019463 [Rhizopus arrhizus]
MGLGSGGRPRIAAAAPFSASVRDGRPRFLTSVPPARPSPRTSLRRGRRASTPHSPASSTTALVKLPSAPHAPPMSSLMSRQPFEIPGITASVRLATSSRWEA